MVSMLVSSAVDRGFEPRSGQTKDYKICICCFSAKHAALRRKSKDWLARNLNNVSKPLPTSVQPISITKTLLIVPTKNEKNPPLFTGKLLIKFQNIMRNTTQVIIRHRVKILFSVISSPITLERQKCKSSKMKGIYDRK
jgi:two-component sensor histidine kinase